MTDWNFHLRFWLLTFICDIKRRQVAPNIKTKWKLHQFCVLCSNLIQFRSVFMKWRLFLSDRLCPFYTTKCLRCIKSYRSTATLLRNFRTLSFNDTSMDLADFFRDGQVCHWLLYVQFSTKSIKIWRNGSTKPEFWTKFRFYPASQNRSLWRPL